MLTMTFPVLSNFVGKFGSSSKSGKNEICSSSTPFVFVSEKIFDLRMQNVNTVPSKLKMSVAKIDSRP